MEVTLSYWWVFCRATSRIGGGATNQVGFGELVCYSFHYESEREQCLSVLVLNACKCRR